MPYLQVLFRYALAVFKYLEEELLQHSDYMAIFHTLRSQVDKLNDVRKLTQVSEEGEARQMEGSSTNSYKHIYLFDFEAPRGFYWTLDIQNELVDLQ